MQPHDDNKPGDELRQKLWELVYELLETDEADELRGRITADPDVARAYCEVVQQSELVARASRYDGPPVVLRAGEAQSDVVAEGDSDSKQGVVVVPRSAKPQAENQCGETRGEAVKVRDSVEKAERRSQRQSKRRAGRTSGRTAMNWVMAVAASVLVCLVGYALVKLGLPRDDAFLASAETRLARQHVRTIVTGPSTIHNGSDARFAVTTVAADGKPLSTDVSYRLYDGVGQLRLDRRAQTDRDGSLLVELPANLLDDQSRLEVETEGSPAGGSLSTHLAVEPRRLATYLSLDKPLYRPGEPVWFRSLTLSRFDLGEASEVSVEYEVLDPSGAAVPQSQQWGFTQRGVGNGAILIPPEAPGGEYTLVARSPNDSFVEQRRTFQVRDFRAPRLKKQLELTRASYGPGDTVVADFSAESAQGDPAAGATLHIRASVDGQAMELADAETVADASGAYRVEFRLPEEIERGSGVVSVTVDDGGTQETIAKTIPINLGKFEVEFYPEGGDLVAGIENRVYFFARDPLGKPVHLEGRIVDESGSEVADAATVREGRGTFRFKPESGREYRFEVTSPQSTADPLPLPKPNADCFVVMDTESGVFDAEQPILLKLRATQCAPLVVAAVCRGVQVGQQAIAAPAVVGKELANTSKQADRVVGTLDDQEPIVHDVRIPLAPEAEGVIRLTVYDYGGLAPRPIAERLVYRRPQRELSVRLVEGNQPRAPGEKVNLVLTVADEGGQPVPAVLGVSVVDDSVLNLADDKSANLLTNFRLASEIEKPEDLEDVNFFLSDDAEAAEELDLLLGTQGWRRFAEAAADEADSADRTNETDGTNDNPTTEANEAEPADVQPDDTPAEEGSAEPASPAAIAARDESVEPPLSFDNSPQVERHYTQALATLHHSREVQLRAAGRMALVGGIGLLALLAISLPLRLVSVGRVGVPALAGAIAAVVVGGMWMSDRVESAVHVAQAPFASFGQRDEAITPPLLVMLQTQAEGAPTIIPWNDYLTAVGVPPGALEQADRTTVTIVEELGIVLVRGRPEDVDRRLAGMLGDDFGAWSIRPGADHFYFAPRFGNDFNENGVAMGRDLYFEDGWHRWRGKFAEAEVRLFEAAKNPFVVGAMELMPNQQAGQAAMGFAYLPDLQTGGVTATGIQANDLTYFSKLYSSDGTVLASRLDLAKQTGNDDLAAKLTTAIQTREAVVNQYRFPIRQYAHQHRTGDDPNVRSDFADTLYWNPLLIADASGRASLEFELSDSITSFRVRTDAHGNGRIGTGEAEIVSRIPLALEPKLPLEVTAGDRIDVPLSIANDAATPLDVDVSLVYGKLLESVIEGPFDSDQRRVTLPAAGRSREFFPLRVVGRRGEAEVQFTGTAGTLSDSVSRKIRVVPPGFPIAESYAGNLEGMQDLTVKLPEHLVPGSLEVSLHAFPSMLADLNKSVEGMLREPGGCFEQASSSNYPNVLVLDFLQQNKLADPTTTRRAREMLSSGYGLLTGYECPDRGYEWFGSNPGHEALTAYGLLEFDDMSRVWNVDQTMIDRTADWLMKRRTGNGGFTRNAKALDSFGSAPQDVTDAYIVWALSEAGRRDLQTELDHVVAMAQESDDAYLVALAAAAALDTEHAQSGALADRLAKLQKDDGHLEAADGTITRSGGLSMQVETTALAAMAWLKSGGHLPQADKAIRWIVESRQGSGGFGSTQATILALKALIAHSEHSSRRTTDGTLVLKREGEEIQSQQFAAGQLTAISLEGIAGEFTSGDNRLEISLTGDNKMPYVLDVSYRTTQPNSQEECPLRLSTKLAADRVAAGDTVGLTVELSNTSGQGQPMSVAVVGLPAGLEPRHEQLKELKDAGRFDYYEVKGRELVFYWRSVGPDVKDDQRIVLNLDLVAEIPGKYEGPASRAYLYYTAEEKQWAEPLRVEIAHE